MIFLTGGARSGKSTLAMRLASRDGDAVRLIVTAKVSDEEMAARVEAHRSHRPPGWTVVEEPVDLAPAIRDAALDEVVLVDCLTLWLSNLIIDLDDEAISEMIEESATAAASRRAQTIVVSNEVGSGIVPMSPVSRRFRDLQGRANQKFSLMATSSYLVVAGRALRLAGWEDVV